MLSFFRKIRWQLAKDNQIFKYSRYALGEIVLVVIGILIALQVNNWNEQRKNREKFKVLIEQVYNEVDISENWLTVHMLSARRQIALIDSLIINPEGIEDDILPFVLFYVDMDSDLSKQTSNYKKDLLDNFEYEVNDLEQLMLTKQINSFVKNMAWMSNSKSGILEPKLNREGFPTPGLEFGYSEYNDFEKVERDMFTEQQIALARKLVKSPEFQRDLRTLRNSKFIIYDISLKNALQEANSLSGIIKDYYPEVRLLYKDIGIIGTALQTGWEETVFMEKADLVKSIWTIDVQLQDGVIKFRSSDSWTQNWGGNGFPNGDAIYFWEDIPVTRGYYRVTLNLEDRTYSFFPL